MTVVPLADATDEGRYGGKATELGAAVRADLPVPDGLAVSWTLVEDLVDGRQPRSGLVDRVRELAGPYVVRSSGIGEDSETASFAGQHVTVVNVRDADGVLDALERVHASAHSEAVQEYRDRLGIEGPPRMGAVVQTLVDADTAGVLFTRNPVDGSDERVVEAAWGLGEAVVDGLVTPDNYRLSPGGEVLACRPGHKEVRVAPDPEGGTRTVSVAESKRDTRCLTDDDLRELDRLAGQCEAYRDGGHDVEWAFAEDGLFLLQRRDITTQA